MKKDLEGQQNANLVKQHNKEGYEKWKTLI